MNVPDHICENIVIIFWVKILKFCSGLPLMLSRFLSALILRPKECFSTRFCRVKMPTEFVSDITVPLWFEVFLSKDGMQNLFSRSLGEDLPF